MSGKVEDRFPGGADLTNRKIKERLVREAEAMVMFALEGGIALAPELLVSLDRALSGTSCMPDAARAEEPGLGARPAAIRPERLSGTTAAAAPVEWTGITAMPMLADSSKQLSLLGGVHLALSKLVAPARPGTLLLLSEERREHPFWSSFGAVPLARQMLVLALLALLLLLGTALSSSVNAENLSRGLLNLQGTKLLVNETFLAAAAMVGATLANLKRLDHFITTSTYDACYEGSYWTRLMMGLISGVILSQVILGTSVGLGGMANAGAAGNAGVGNAGISSAGVSNVLANVGQPILALLGGFSGELVHNILAHLIAVIGNLFGGGQSAPAIGDVAVPKTSGVADH